MEIIVSKEMKISENLSKSPKCFAKGETTLLCVQSQTTAVFCLMPLFKDKPLVDSQCASIFHISLSTNSDV